MMGRYLLSKFNLIYTMKGVLGPKLLLAMGCEKVNEKNAFTCLLWVNKPQINYPISRNPWQVIISGPVVGARKWFARG